MRIVTALLTLTFASTVYAQATPLPKTPLVSAEWLAAQESNPRLVVLHVSTRANYDAAHLKGARFTELSALALSGVGPDTLNLELPAPDDLRKRLEALGISDSSVIVVVAGGNMWLTHSTRVMFTLDHAGFGARSFLLDGGAPRWIAEGRSTTTEAPSASQGSITPRPVRESTVSLDWLAQHTQKAGIAVIDARATQFYDGTGQNRHRPGHVPGAKSIPFSTIFTETQQVKSVDDLRRMFTAAGVAQSDTVVAYCHIGQQATAVVFAARMLGMNVKLFDGSFEQWSRHTQLPVVK